MVCLAIGGLVCRGLVDEQGVPDETDVPLAALGVEDPERRPTARWAVAVVGHERLGPMPDDVPPEPDPRPTGQLEPDAGRLGDGGREATGEPRGVEDEEERPGTPGERSQPMQPVADPCRLVRPGQATAGQVEDEEVDRSTGQQAARDAESLVEAGRRDDDEPVEVDAPGNGFDRVEAARQVEPGDDRALGLCLGDDPEAQCRASARALSADRDAGRPGQAARSEDRVQCREAGPDDAVVGPRVVSWRLLDLGWGGRQGQRPDHPRSCGTPPSPEARDGGVHITPTGRHETVIVEHLF
jgi:hypothetical protein